MTVDNSQVSAALVKQGAAPKALSAVGFFDSWKVEHAPRLVALAGSKERADRMFTACYTSIVKNPKLLECTAGSLTNCILQSFQLGLFPGPFGECSYVPLNNGKTGKKEANFWPEYGGLVKLIMESGARSVTARVVYDGDFFQFAEGLEAPKYVPAICLGQARGKRRFVYAAICTASGMWQVEVMSPEQIEVIRSRSRGAEKPDSPWNSKNEDDVNWMWRKTAVKQCQKLVPKNAQLAQALEADNFVDGDPSITPDGAGAFNLPLAEGEEGQENSSESDANNVNSQNKTQSSAAQEPQKNLSK